MRGCGTLFILNFFVFISVLYAACPSATYVDSYASLPASPVFPSAEKTSGLPVISSSLPLIENHWSETSNLAAYRREKIHKKEAEKSEK